MGGANDAALNIILGSKDETGPGMDSAEGKVGKLGKTVAGMHQAWAVAGAATATAVGFLADASRAAIDDAEDVDHLRVAVENSGASWKDVEGKINARITAGQKLAFTDDQTRDSLALLVAETGSYEEAMKRQQFAMDFARGAHIDLNTASKLLGKVTDDNVKVLGRYGIHVQQVALSEKEKTAITKQLVIDQDVQAKATQHLQDVEAAQAAAAKAGHKATIADQNALRDAHAAVEKATTKVTDAQAQLSKGTSDGATQAALFAEVQKRYGGQAEAYGNSTKGQIDRLKDAFGEWKESIGYTLGPMQGVLAMLPAMSAGFSLAGAASGFLTAEVSLLGDRSILMAAKAGIVRVATMAWTGMQWLLNAALSANPIGLVVIGIALLVAGFILAYTHIKPFHDAVNGAWGGIKTFAEGIWTTVKPALEWLWDTLKNVTGLLLSVTTGNIGGVASALHNLHIPGFADGGTVPGPRGAPLLAIVHGGEEIIPNGRGGGGSSSVSHHYNLTLVGSAAVNDPEAMRRMLLRMESMGVSA